MERIGQATTDVVFETEAPVTRDLLREASSLIELEDGSNSNHSPQFTQHFLDLYHAVNIGVAKSLGHTLHINDIAVGVHGGIGAANSITFGQTATHNGPLNRTPHQAIIILSNASIGIDRNISASNNISFNSNTIFGENAIINRADVLFFNRFGEELFNTHYTNVGFTRGYTRFKSFLDFDVTLSYTADEWDFTRDSEPYQHYDFYFGGNPVLAYFFNYLPYLPSPDHERYIAIRSGNWEISMEYDSGLGYWVIVRHIYSPASIELWFSATPIGPQVPTLATTWTHNPLVAPGGTTDVGKTDRRQLYKSAPTVEYPSAALIWSAIYGEDKIGRLTIL